MVNVTKDNNVYSYYVRGEKLEPLSYPEAWEYCR